jgi:hypothetical protein
MNPAEMFAVVDQKGKYVVGQIRDGWTFETEIIAATPREAMVKIGDITNVTFVERER